MADHSALDLSSGDRDRSHEVVVHQVYPCGFADADTPGLRRFLRAGPSHSTAPGRCELKGGWALRATGRGLATTAALEAAAVVVIAVVDSSAALLWGWSTDPIACSVTVVASLLGAALAFAVLPGQVVPPRPAR